MILQWITSMFIEKFSFLKWHKLWLKGGYGADYNTKCRKTRNWRHGA